MTTPDANRSPESWSGKPYTPSDFRVYSQLRQEMEGTSHGSLFGTREFDESHDPLGLLHLENAFVPSYHFDAERFEYLKQGIIFNLLITEPSFDVLVDSMDEALKSDAVAEHTGPDNNGSILWASNHISYADIAALLTARTEVNIRHKVENPTNRVVAIISRIITLFELSLLASRDTDEGFVVDNGLLHLAGILQTVPASASGSRVRQIVGSGDINENVRKEYSRLLNIGTEFFVATSGEQDKKEDGMLVMGTVSKGTVDFATEPNQVDGAERLLAIPVFIDCNPFTRGEFSGAVAATHKILEPRFLHDEAQVTSMMLDIAYEGNVHKRSGTLPIAYRRPQRMSHVLGRFGVGGTAFYKD